MAPRSRKRAKNSTSTSKNVVLKAFIGMPIDIIFEVRQILRSPSQALLSVQRSTRNLGIWISGTFGPLATCSDYQGSASYSHEPLIVVSVEARSTRVLSNA